jgi:hypothetical protein
MRMVVPTVLCIQEVNIVFENVGYSFLCLQQMADNKLAFLSFPPSNMSKAYLHNSYVLVTGFIDVTSLTNRSQGPLSDI